MLKIKGTPDYKAAVREWLCCVQEEVNKECAQWEKYKEVTGTIDQLMIMLMEQEMTNNQIDDIYSAIGDYRYLAANVAYIIGLRDGFAAQKTLENLTITAFLDKNEVD